MGLHSQICRHPFLFLANSFSVFLNPSFKLDLLYVNLSNSDLVENFDEASKNEAN